MTTDRPRKMRAQTRTVRLQGLAGRETSFYAFTTLPDQPNETRVRYNAGPGITWKCDTHGPQPTPTCEHTRAAATVFDTYQENNPPTERTTR